MALSSATLRRYFRTPKGLLVALLGLMTVVAAVSEGLLLVAPGVAAAVITAMVVDAPLLRWREREWLFPDGAMLTGLIVAMILSPYGAWWIAAVASAIAIASKYLLRAGSANIFNPAALALVIVFYAFDAGHSWWGALDDAPVLTLAALFATGIYITNRVNKVPLVLTFLGTYYLLVTLAAFMGQSERVAGLYRMPDVNAALYFAFFMVTDPPTSPPKRRDQVIFGMIVAATSFAAFEITRSAHYLLAGLLAANAWEAVRRRRVRVPASAVAAAAILALSLSACSGLRRVTGVGGGSASAFYELASATDIDTIGGFATLPAHSGLVRGHTVWYIVTESSDRADAAKRGVTWAPRLKALATTPAVQRARAIGRVLEFEAGVDFSMARTLSANPDSAFPPRAASPGSLGDPFYSPFVLLDNGTVINAPIIASEHEALDRVVRLDPGSGTVRIRMSRGYAGDHTVWYTSTEASDPAVAAMERATLAPSLRWAPGEGSSATDGSARTGILAVTNGETGADNPERQGLRSALLDDRAPLNILEHAPDPSGKNPVYSPAWDLSLARWTSATIAANQRQKIFSWGEAQALISAGAMVRTLARVVINCPVIAVYPRRHQ